MKLQRLKNLIKEEIKRLNEHKKCTEDSDCDVSPYYVCHEGTCVEEDFSNPYPDKPINDKSLRQLSQMVSSQGDPKMSKWWKDFLNWLANRRWI